MEATLQSWPFLNYQPGENKDAAPSLHNNLWCLFRATSPPQNVLCSSGTLKNVATWRSCVECPLRQACCHPHFFESESLGVCLFVSESLGSWTHSLEG